MLKGDGVFEAAQVVLVGDSWLKRYLYVMCPEPLFRRVEAHCSNTALKVEEESKIMEELQANGYPKKFIEITRKKMRLPKNKDRNYMEVVIASWLICF